MAVVRPQKNRGEGGTQGERDKARNHSRSSDGGRELLEEQTRDARDKGRGHEHSAEGQRDGDERGGYFAHRLMRRLARRHAIGHAALDVLDHDDGVVDHDAHRQHQAKQ